MTDTLGQSGNGRFAMLLTLIGSIVVLIGVVVQVVNQSQLRETAERKEAVILLDRTLQNELEKSAISIEKGISSLDAISESRHLAQQEEMIYRYETLAQRIERLELREIE